jgi:prepilin-type N-terminal cleavage/methylation domain-containing protein
MSRTHNRDSLGFTLIEVLVGLTILSISLVVFLRVFAIDLDRSSESRARTMAVSWTQSLLAQVGNSIPLRVGQTTGEFPDGFRWRLEMQPYGSSDDQNAWSTKALIVSASVIWGQDNRSVTLSTLRLVPKDLP